MNPDRLAHLRLENERLEGELKGLHAFISSLVALEQATEASNRESEVYELLSLILDNLISATGACDGSLLAQDPKTKELMFVLVGGDSPNQALIGRRLPRGRGIAAWVTENRRPAIVNNTRIDDRFYGDLDLENDYRTESLLAAPLIGGQRVLGVVEVLNKRGGGLFSLGNQSLLTLMCRFAGELLYTVIKDVDLTREEFRPVATRAKERQHG